MFWPVAVHTPLPGVRIAEPSSSVYEPGPDHRAHRRHADDLAEAERLEAGGEHLGVRRRALVLHHDHRAVEVLRPRLLEAGVAADACTDTARPARMPSSSWSMPPPPLKR